MFRLIISDKARKELRKLKREHQMAIMAVLEEIQENPLVGKPLTRELSGRFSYKMGLFRIIYKVNEKDKIISIITAGHRAMVYN